MALTLTLSLFIYRYLTIHLSSTVSGDSVSYLAMVNAFISDVYGPVAAPFNLRILAPWLASIIAENGTTGFIVLNALAELLFIIFWFAISRELKLRNAEFWLLTLWFLYHPLGFPFYTVYPDLVDPLCYALMGLVTLLFITQQRTLMWLVVALALLAKESFIFISLVIAAAELVYAMTNTSTSHNKQAIASACTAAFVLYIYQHITTFIQNDLFPSIPPRPGSIMHIILQRLHLAWHDPKRFIVWLGAIFCVTGVFTIGLLLKKLPTTTSPSQLRVDTYFIIERYQ
jgi:hypothetical protein